jgi:D-3-phosphoglycerate dehydrogenase
VEGNIGMFDQSKFDQMKRSAIFINTPGEPCEGRCLIAALSEGKIAGAGLDSFASEPLSPKSPLLRCQNLLMTPHIGGNTGTWKRTCLTGHGKHPQNRRGEKLAAPDLG